MSDPASVPGPQGTAYDEKLVRSAHQLFERQVSLHGATQIEGSPTLPVVFRTVPQPWDAISLPRTSSTPSSSILVRVRLIVDEGAISVGLMHVSGSGFLHQLEVHATGGKTVPTDLVAIDAAQCGELMIRNASAFGASRGTLVDVQYLELLNDADDVRHPSLAEPSAFPRWSRHYGTEGLDAATMLRAGQFDRLRAPQVMRWDDGLALRLAPKDQSCRALYLSGTYEPNTLRILRAVLRPGDVFIDVGANAGIISLAASRWVGPEGCVYAFEPSTREFARLTDAMALNQAAQIIPERAAVTSTSGTVSLKVAEQAHGGLNTVGDSFAYSGVEVAAVEDVPAVSLDDFASTRGLRQVNAIKIDVEGAEGEVLQGAQQVLARFGPVLVIELFGRSLASTGWTVERLQQLLADAGYSFFRIDDETGLLAEIAALGEVDEQNVVAAPAARRAWLLDVTGR